MITTLSSTFFLYYWTCLKKLIENGLKNTCQSTHSNLPSFLLGILIFLLSQVQSYRVKSSPVIFSLLTEWKKNISDRPHKKNQIFIQIWALLDLSFPWQYPNVFGNKALLLRIFQVVSECCPNFLTISLHLYDRQSFWKIFKISKSTNKNFKIRQKLATNRKKAIKKLSDTDCWLFSLRFSFDWDRGNLIYYYYLL